MPRLVAILLVIAAVGCHDVSKDIAKFADRACACTDKACAEKVIDELVEFAKKNKNAKGDEGKAAEEGARMMKCAMTAGLDQSALATKMKGIGD